MTEQEQFWENESFVVVTDNTKPAMRWTAEELERRGKSVYVLDLSGKPEEGSITRFSGLPQNIDCAVIGLTRSSPEDAAQELMRLGIKKLWIHWGTDASGVKEMCQETGADCIAGRCPMMYLAKKGFNMHSIHRAAAKIFGKY